jgi:fluoride exporter
VSTPLWVGIALIGGGATVVRFALDGLIRARNRSHLPLGTFAINTTGSLLLGLLTGLALTGNALILAGTAALGSYTTFSTWLLESHRLAQDTRIASALVNVLLTLAAGIGAAALGHAIGARA